MPWYILTPRPCRRVNIGVQLEGLTVVNMFKRTKKAQLNNPLPWSQWSRKPWNSNPVSPKMKTADRRLTECETTVHM